MTIAAGQVTPEQRKAGRDRLARWSRPVLGLLLPVTAALLWEFAVRMGYASGRLVPPPSVIFATFVELAQAGVIKADVDVNGTVDALIDSSVPLTN